MPARHTAEMRMRTTVGAIWVYIVVLAIVGTPLYVVVATSGNPEDVESWLAVLMFTPAAAALVHLAHGTDPDDARRHRLRGSLSRTPVVERNVRA